MLKRDSSTFIWELHALSTGLEVIGVLCNLIGTAILGSYQLRSPVSNSLANKFVRIVSHNSSYSFVITSSKNHRIHSHKVSITS